MGLTHVWTLTRVGREIVEPDGSITPARFHLGVFTSLEAAFRLLADEGILCTGDQQAQVRWIVGPNHPGLVRGYLPSSTPDTPEYWELYCQQLDGI